MEYIKNKTIKLVYGIGISDIQSTYDGIVLKSYHKWIGMLGRCYYKSTFISHPSYIVCSVCDAWKVYSNFKKWFDEHYIDGYELDKDILIDGNKVYSPETCCFVPRYINLLFGDHEKGRGNYLIGVSFDKSRNLYQAKLSMYSKCYNLGRFNNEIDAHNAWLKAKRDYTRKLAIDAYMNNEIDERIMNAIIKKAYNLK